ncbi:LysE family translocator, partial [Sandarakinorhabdus oryzae]|uniref:LysE family translocator n=1 Tax=Sandarakinorhabdus oryzae TaxID=2675220 RepID=UPI0012E1F43A
AVTGVALGLLANGILAALGLAALLQAAPQLWTGLRLAGAAMMAWLALDAWRGAARPVAAPAADNGARRAFLTGAFINLLNPKAYVFFVVVAPQFMAGHTLGLQSALVLACISAAIATAIHIAIVAAAARAQALLQDAARMRLVRRLFALVMLGVAVSFLWADLG